MMFLFKNKSVLLVYKFIFSTLSFVFDVLVNKNKMILLRHLDFMFYWKKFLVDSLELVTHRYSAKMFIPKGNRFY